METSLNNYCNTYEKTAKEIREGMEEGFNEGLREGIQQGFVAGIRECMVTGFDKIDVKSMEEILKDAFKTASDEATSITVRQTATNEYREKISPAFKKKMEEACNNAVEEIKDTDFELEEISASKLKDRVGASIEKIKESIGKACGGMKKNFPSDIIFGNFFECLQEEFNRELEENLGTCEKRIYKEIDSKIDGKKDEKKPDHSRQRYYLCD